MDPENEQFIAKHNILQSMKGKIILKGENGKFSDLFFQTFLDVINRLDGNLFIAFLNVNFESCENLNVEHTGEILSNKMERGDKVFVIDYKEQRKKHEDEIAYDILFAMDGWFSISYHSAITKRKSKERNHFINFNFETSVEDTKILIDMMDNDIFLELKQYLVQILPKLEERTPTWQEGDAICDKCDAATYFKMSRLLFKLFQPDWSNCTGCVL